MLQGRFEVVQISAGTGTDVHQGFRDTGWKKKPTPFLFIHFLKERARNLQSSRGEPALQPLSHPGPRNSPPYGAPRPAPATHGSAHRPPAAVAAAPKFSFNLHFLSQLFMLTSY